MSKRLLPFYAVACVLLVLILGHQIKRRHTSTQNAEIALHFPKNFTWGLATSAWQTEGGNGKTDWDVWSAYQNSKPTHPGFLQEDILLAQKLSVQEIRFSIEWARVEPAEGKWDAAEIGRYTQIARTMHNAGIKPFINLHHFTLPEWVAAKGGLECKEFPLLFARYAQKMAAEMRGIDVAHWMTFNEPMVPVEMGYLNGNWPPFHKADVIGATTVMHNIARAHKLAYGAIHRERDGLFSREKVGVAYFDHLYVPKDPKDRGDVQVAAFLEFFGASIMMMIEDSVDYVGINYYNRTIVGHRKTHQVESDLPVLAEYYPPTRELSEEGMEIYPEGISLLIERYRKYRKPIIITENGIGDAQDNRRAKFIVQHLREVHKALNEPENEAAPIIGYFYWTLADNFEWNVMRMSSFGLIAVDRESKKRTVRPSGFLYKEIIERNGLSGAMLSKYK